MPRPATKRPGDDDNTASSAEQTRKALVIAALKLFGTVGYDGASTREIAAAANANLGSIAYHFGGKEGLRLADERLLYRRPDAGPRRARRRRISPAAAGYA